MPRGNKRKKKEKANNVRGGIETDAMQAEPTGKEADGSGGLAGSGKKRTGENSRSILRPKRTRRNAATKSLSAAEPAEPAEQTKAAEPVEQTKAADEVDSEQSESLPKRRKIKSKDEEAEDEDVEKKNEKNEEKEEKKENRGRELLEDLEKALDFMMGAQGSINSINRAIKKLGEENIKYILNNAKKLKKGVPIKKQRYYSSFFINKKDKFLEALNKPKPATVITKEEQKPIDDKIAITIDEAKRDWSQLAAKKRITTPFGECIATHSRYAPCIYDKNGKPPVYKEMIKTLENSGIPEDQIAQALINEDASVFDNNSKALEAACLLYTIVHFAEEYRKQGAIVLFNYLLRQVKNKGDLRKKVAEFKFSKEKGGTAEGKRQIAEILASNTEGQEELRKELAGAESDDETQKRKQEVYTAELISKGKKDHVRDRTGKGNKGKDSDSSSSDSPMRRKRSKKE